MLNYIYLAHTDIYAQHNAIQTLLRLMDQETLKPIVTHQYWRGVSKEEINYRTSS